MSLGLEAGNEMFSSKQTESQIALGCRQQVYFAYRSRGRTQNYEQRSNVAHLRKTSPSTKHLLTVCRLAWRD